MPSRDSSSVSRRPRDSDAAFVCGGRSSGCARLQELVREKGYKGAARVLEIDQATVTESAKTGQLTRRVRQALERALQEGVGSAAERQRQRNEQLEERVEGVAADVKGVAGEVEALGKEARRRLSAIEGEVAALRRDDPPGDRGRSCRRRSLPWWC